MLKKYDGTNWNTASYGKYFSGTEQFTNFPLVIRSLDQSVQAYTIKGNISVSGNPSPQNPVTVDGVGEETANLLNPEGNWTDYNCTHSVSGGNITVTGIWFSYLAFTAKPNTTYSMQYNNVTNQHIAIYKNTVSGTPYTATYTNFLKFTTDTATQFYIVFYAGSGSSERTVEYKNVRLYEGDYTSQTIPDYEPYGKYKISISSNGTALTPMYFSQQLMAIANTKDEYSSSGTATYNTYKLVLTGNEMWTYQSTYSRFYTPRTDVKFTGNRLVPMLCTHYGVIDDGRSIDDIPNNSLYATGYVDEPTLLCIKTDAYSTEQTFKEYLATQYAAGTPVTIYYILKTQTTETVTAPTIPTTGGTATIDVDTTVKPSEVSLTYNGKHLNKSKKYNGNNWT